MNETFGENARAVRGSVTKDTYVRADYTTRNYGTSPTLAANGSSDPVMVALLRFHLDGIPTTGVVVQATRPS